jgi:hypothetical protein
MNMILLKQILFRFITVSILVSLPAFVAAENDAAESSIGEAIPRLIEQFSRSSGIGVPELQAEDIEILLAGKSIISPSGESGLESNGGVESVGLLGLQLVNAPRLLVWLTVLGGAGRSDDRFTNVMLSRMLAGTYSRYQHVNLPWPIRDRHWVIVSEKNIQLAKASAGVVWEHRWSLHQTGEHLLKTAYEDGRISGLKMSALDDSIYIPENRGSWALFDLGQNRTLVLAFYDAKLGGRLPGRLVHSISKRQLRKYLEGTRQLTDQVLQHYDGNSLIHDGFGLPISRKAAIDAALAWAKL